MKCPKCGYNSFEYLNNCRKCGIDLAGFKNTLGLRPVILPPAVSAQQSTETVAAGEIPAPVAAAETASSEMFHWETPVDTEATIPQQPETSPFAFDLDEPTPPPAAPEEPFAFIDQPSPGGPSMLTESTPESPAAVTLSDFSFEEQEPAEPEQPAATTAEIPASDIDKAFGEFVFGEEPAAPVEEAAPVAPPVMDESTFGEFAFGEEPAAPAAETAPAEPPVIDENPFGEFAFGEELAPQPVETAPPVPSAAEESPFGEFAFGEEPGAAAEAVLAAQPVIDENPFGEFAFGEEPAAQSAETAPSAPSAADSPFGEFAFDEEPALPTAQPAAPDFSLESFGDLTEEQLQQDAGTAPEEFELESVPISAGDTPAAEDREKRPSPGGAQFTKDEFDALFGELEALEKKK